MAANPTADAAAGDSAAPAAPASTSKLPLILALVGVIAGVAGGFIVTGPLLSKRLGYAASAPAEHKPETHEAKPVVVHLVENLVLNPAASGGTRFLMVAVALETNESAVNDEMNKRDAELRDKILRVLGARTVEQLADIAMRDSLKQEIGAEMSRMFGKKAVSKVYFPQFVIQ